MAFVRDTERLRKDSSLAAHLLRRKRQRGLIRGCEERKGRHCSTKRIERLWARGCLMPHNGTKSGANEATTENFAMIWCLLSFSFLFVALINKF
ncbi:hypothetical protein TNCV_459751 [Trichonephila clavipes]|nr:hypothetical protein TNCV_459751 [Trichonephila clavipes]